MQQSQLRHQGYKPAVVVEISTAMSELLLRAVAGAVSSPPTLESGFFQRQCNFGRRRLKGELRGVGICPEDAELPSAPDSYLWNRTPPGREGEAAGDSWKTLPGQPRPRGLQRDELLASQGLLESSVGRSQSASCYSGNCRREDRRKDRIGSPQLVGTGPEQTR